MPDIIAQSLVYSYCTENNICSAKTDCCQKVLETEVIHGAPGFFQEVMWVQIYRSGLVLSSRIGSTQNVGFWSLRSVRSCLRSSPQ